MYKAQKELLRALITEDGTYNAIGEKVSYKTGYQVTFETTKELSSVEFNNLVNTFLKFVGEASFGCYCGSIEISFHTESFTLAMSLAKQFNQYSIWDWEAMQEIKNSYWHTRGNNIR